MLLATEPLEPAEASAAAVAKVEGGRSPRGERSDGAELDAVAPPGDCCAALRLASARSRSFFF